MPVTTRKTNAEVHPGRVLIESQQPRRTKKQIEEDDARASAAAQDREVKATAKLRAVAECIAYLEDMVALAEMDSQTHAQRPDLHYRRHDSFELREERDDGFGSEKGRPQSGVADAGDDDEGPGPARDNNSDDNAGQIPSGDEGDDIPVRYSVKRKGVSPHF